MALLIIPVLKGGRELEVRMATFGPGIDQSQHAKSVSHITITNINAILQHSTLICIATFTRSQNITSYTSIRNASS